MTAWVAGLVLAGCSMAPAKAEVTGTITIPGKPLSYSATPTEGDSCRVKDGYSDVDFGTTVTIRDGKGEIVGVGMVGAPLVTFDGQEPTSFLYWCRFRFTVKDVQRGRDFYSVEVGRRGQVSYEEERLFGSGPSLTLG